MRNQLRGDDYIEEFAWACSRTFEYIVATVKRRTLFFLSVILERCLRVFEGGLDLSTACTNLEDVDGCYITYCTITPAPLLLHNYSCTITPAKLHLHNYCCTITAAPLPLTILLHYYFCALTPHDPSATLALHHYSCCNHCVLRERYLA